MPKPEDPSKEALRRLDKDLDAFDAQRKAQASPLGGAQDAGDGYRMLAGLIGGVLGGLGLGWFFDSVVGHFVHTSPWGLISGLLIGLVASTYAAIRSASQMSARMVEKLGTAPPAPDDDGDE